MQGPAAEQMEMDMIDRLPTIGSAIGDDAESASIHTFCFGDLIRGCVNRTDQFLVGCLQIEQGRNMFFGYDQQMRRGLGVDVPNR